MTPELDNAQRIWELGKLKRGTGRRQASLFYQIPGTGISVTLADIGTPQVLDGMIGNLNMIAPCHWRAWRIEFWHLGEDGCTLRIAASKSKGVGFEDRGARYPFLSALSLEAERNTGVCSLQSTDDYLALLASRWKDIDKLQSSDILLLLEFDGIKRLLENCLSIVGNEHGRLSDHGDHVAMAKLNSLVRFLDHRSRLRADQDFAWGLPCHSRFLEPVASLPELWNKIYQNLFSGDTMFVQNAFARGGVQCVRKRRPQLLGQNTLAVVVVTVMGREVDDNKWLLDRSLKKAFLPYRQKLLVPVVLSLPDGTRPWRGSCQQPHVQRQLSIRGDITLFELPGRVTDTDSLRGFKPLATQPTLTLLAQEQCELRKLIDALPVLVAYVDGDQRYRIVNKTYERWYVRPCAEVEGKTIREMMGEARYALLKTNVERALNGLYVRFELEFDYPDGKRRFIRASYVPDRNGDGSIAGMFLVVEDLTEIHQTTKALRRARDEVGREVSARTMELTLINANLRWEIAERERTEQALAESELRFRRMADTAPIMIWLVNAERNTLYLNQQAQEFLGTRSSEISFVDWCSVMHPDDEAVCRRRFNMAFDHRAPIEQEYRLQQANGNFRWFIERARPRFTPEGEFMGYIGTCSDITERREAEQARLEYAIGQRSVLVREVHHRIKNHLQGLMALLERLESRCPTAAPLFQEAGAQIQVIATIHGLQAQSTVSQPALRAVIDAIVATLQSLTKVPIETHCTTELADPQLEESYSVAIALVINELLLNAVKHGQFGVGNPGISVYMSSNPEAFVVSVRNPGCMPEDMKVQTASVAGTGLGLSRLLLPATGAELEIAQSGPFVEAELRLSAPVLVMEPVWRVPNN